MVLGTPIPAAVRREFLRWTHRYWAQSLDLLVDMQDFPDQELFWENYTLRSLLNLGYSMESAQVIAPELTRYMQNEHHPVDWVPPEVYAALAELKACGYRLGLVSNRTHPCQELLVQLKLDHYFDLALVAGEVNCWKPEPCVFEHALKSLDLAPMQVVYVGDNYYADVVGARQAGLIPILIDPDGIFPDATCPVIRQMDELPAVLERL